MKLKTILENKNFSPQAIEAICSSGIKDLYPPQEEAVNKGILDGKNVLMSVPTAAGKTLIAELCMLNSILHNSGVCLYIAPLKALASEKYNDFKKKYENLGVRVGLAIGDADTPVKNLNQYNIIVATAEKVDSLLRSKASWLIEALNVVILDEVHFINDGERGPTMEILIARIKQLNPKIQFLALSATVSNAQELAQWLEANLVSSTWRPIPLKEGVYHNERIVFDQHGTRIIAEDAKDDLSKMTLDTLRGKGQVLIFVNSRRSAQAVSRQVSKAVASTLTDDEKDQLKELSKKMRGSASDATKICHSLAEVVLNGCAFHHAGLKPKQRELIENNFKKNLIKIISCTPTLAAGVNLPARRAIIRDSKRFESGVGQSYIPTSEYKQCAGRAGRPQYDEYGEAVLVAKSPSESSTLFEKYIHAAPEPVTSKLDNEASLRIHILASIAGGYVHDINGMFDFVSHTFLYHQKNSPYLFDTITTIFEFLHKEGFIDKSGYRFFATPLGALTSRLYIDPATTIIIRNGLQKIGKIKSLPVVGMLHLLSCTPDAPLAGSVGKDLVEEIEHFVSEFHDDFILTPQNFPEIDDYFTFLSTVKTTWLLLQWVEETREDIICEKFNVGPGDIYRHIESTQWLLYAASTIAELLHQKTLTFELMNLKNRVRYGIKEELLNLVQLKGIGRIRARILFDKGYAKTEDLKHISPDELANTGKIGKTLAQDIIKQANAVKTKLTGIRQTVTHEVDLEDIAEWEE